MIVRRDLPLGFLAAQVVHAAGESSPGDLAHDTHAVVLSVRDERELRAVHERLERAGIEHVLICEPDVPWNGAATAIGVSPSVARKEVKKHLSMLPLLR